MTADDRSLRADRRDVRQSRAHARRCPARPSLGAATSGLLACLLTGCAGQQSSLDPAGTHASRIAELFWVLIIGSAVIWLGVVAVAVYATYAPPRPLGRKARQLLVFGGGVAFPVVVLTVVLTHSLWTLPDHLGPAPAGSLTVEVTGLQWWWRVRYAGPSGPIELANEIHLPVGEPVQIELESADVIHSFWVPSLGGKVDMIPGRRTRLRLEPSKVGVYRGTCAEYCGASHAFMAFYVVVEDRASFDRWLAEQAKPARAADGEMAMRGSEHFVAHGCGACHAVRGTRARGVIGPDLTHVGGRVSLAAGILPSDADSFRRWVSRASFIKPNVHMPAFSALPDDELRALAAYLEALQ